ncbi:MAG: NAD(P)-dependent oxidoreductase [Planctomycetota bacterium]
MKIILTGCNGGLGSEVTRTLIERKHEVLGTDLEPRADAPCRVVLGDLLDPFFVHRLIDELGEVDAIVHIANHPHQHAAPPDRLLRENTAMNTHVFLAAADRRVRRVVFASSIQAWMGGKPHDESVGRGGIVDQVDRLPIDERTTLQPRNVYGLSKMLGEQMLDAMCRDQFSAGRLSAASLRFPWIAPSAAQAARWAHWHIRSLAERDVDLRDLGSYVTREDAALGAALAAEAAFTGHERLWIVAPDTRFAPRPVHEVAREYFADTPGVEWVIEHGNFFNVERTEAVLGWRGKPEFSRHVSEALAEQGS